MSQTPDCEYVIVGSGAGGGTLAARLAEAGRSVILLEAGGDAKGLGAGARLPSDYDVPVFHPFASENPALAWNFFVRHYEGPEQAADPKYRPSYNGQDVDGVLYPRAGTLGGCTAHNAMILLYPHNADWEGIAALTGDPSWAAPAMHRYFRRLEDCRHRPLHRWLSRLGIDLTRHGWKGWLRTEHVLPRTVLGERPLIKVVLAVLEDALASAGRPLDQLRKLFKYAFDPNDWRRLKNDEVGVRYVPLTTRAHARAGARERVLDTASRHPDRLKIRLHALATRVLFDGDRAIGVEYLSGERLYRAHPEPNAAPGERRQVFASREVILAGGAFNTPQLLMLSGIGPRDELERHRIPVRVDLPVGRNLQDRYEISIVNRMPFAHWQMLDGAQFAEGDRYFREWAAGESGVYATNGTMLGLIMPSTADRRPPDLFCLVLLGKFEGYYPGYSADLLENLNCLSWTILKAHTNNRAGDVRLRSADPRDPPLISFRYFDPKDDPNGEDLESVLHGVKLVRAITNQLTRAGLVGPEEAPGGRAQTDPELRDHIRANAWGHHASCTCPIGPRAAGGVVDSRFRVYGTRRLRVVDASVFPRIPGFFIVSAVYMIGEKAADVILADAAHR
jgi:choline dehydrogenase-like flavoprotein